MAQNPGSTPVPVAPSTRFKLAPPARVPELAGHVQNVDQRR